jgi:hypothetical protein
MSPRSRRRGGADTGNQGLCEAGHSVDWLLGCCGQITVRTAIYAHCRSYVGTGGDTPTLMILLKWVRSLLWRGAVIGKFLGCVARYPGKL